ncbi:MAG: helix-turn-helix domain-containing protein [bacterium]|nr:helix-turn-helix domain-containing protein [bacterium]
MPHVSAKKLTEEKEKVIKLRLVKIFHIIGKDNSALYSLREFFTDTEMIMLAKRLSIIYLVGKEIPTLEICEVLKVSSSTVIRIEKRFDRGGYQHLRKVLKKLEPSLVDIIETILGAGLPPIAGRGRWDFLKNF